MSPMRTTFDWRRGLFYGALIGGGIAVAISAAMFFTNSRELPSLPLIAIRLSGFMGRHRVRAGRNETRWLGDSRVEAADSAGVDRRDDLADDGRLPDRRGRHDNRPSGLRGDDIRQLRNRRASCRPSAANLWELRIGFGNRHRGRIGSFRRSHGGGVGSAAVGFWRLRSAAASSAPASEACRER